ncbi:phospholipid-transporting ATPase ABCA7 isoform X2 [Dromiciops gliroides]|uniref:phospholipid-transporting ATPase ABCA7 isoform X2 n=1 Tax=Dromiciops gliroides TaxID=33562 RepID=UPI001CC56C11|nr:phospholipid-transporting ATPase ABCA7 isoform X2 [Dromiciops gliroides]
MAFWTQLMLLLWKNFTYRKRKPLQLVIELLWPLFLFLILVAVRQSHPPFEHHECHFPNKPLPSAGLLPWLQGIVCNMNNPCYRYATPGETPGVLNNFNESLVSRLLADARLVLSSPNTQRTLRSFGKLMPSLKPLQESALPLQSYLLPGETFSKFLQENTSLPQSLAEELLETQLSLQGLPPALPLPDLVCNATLLSTWLNASEALQKGLCALPPKELRALGASFLSQADPDRLLAALKANNRQLSPKAVSTFLEAWEAMSRELSTLPSLAELRAELRRDPGPGGPLEGVSRVLCGKSRDQGVEIPSLNWYEDDDLKVMLGQGQGRLASPVDNNTSPFCQKLIESMEAHPISRLLWWRLKPIILGKILYTPDTPLTRRVMAKVNQTFHQLALLRELHAFWKELAPQISSFMNNSDQVAVLKRVFQTTSWEERLRRTRNRTSALRSFLGLDGSGYSWKEAHEDLTLIVDKVGQVLECVSLDKLEPVTTEDSLMTRAVELLGQRRFWAGIVFLGLQDGRAPSHIRLKIRMDIDDVTRTNKIKDRFWDPGPAADPFLDMRYVWGGFVYLQDLLEGAVLRVLNSSAHPASIYLQQMPYPCYVDDVFLRVLNRSLPLFLTLAWIYSVALTVKGVVQEKETRLRDTMLAMGLGRSVLWGSWFISSLLPFLISSGLLVLILKQGDILPYSDPLLVFLFLAAFAVATVCQGFLFSAAFSHANVAAACGGLLYFTLYLPYVLCVAWRDRLPPALRLAASLLSPVAFGFGCEYFSLYEEQGVGIQWHNMGQSPVAGDGYNLALCEALLIMDAGLYAVATWYTEAICPGQYGIPQPWNFPFRKSYWCGELALVSLDLPSSKDDPQVLVEEPSPGLQVGVSLRGLVKLYPGSTRPALQGLSLDFYEGHITAFLGHNGAGKTTTLSILSGLFPPTRGSALILGQDVSSSRAAVHQSLGLCPQHNVLFDILTVEEHIWFYGRLKGLSQAAVGQELPRLLQDVGLPHKRQEQTRHLSGGMQRKLSVAIAFVGGSRVVILDEPTAGVDPFSRRGIWELLLKYRQGRTVILSTHYMDEAELLGDRVAVIAAGQLRCCGSPLFLKSRLGTGYYLTLVKHQPTMLLKAGKDHDGGRPEGNWSKGLESKEGSLAGATDVAQLLTLVQRLVPGAQLVEELGHEVVLTLPYAGAHNGAFGELFQQLDRRLEELGISGYGISDTTLEEIFLKVAEDSGVDRDPEDGEGQPLRRGLPAPTSAHCQRMMNEEHAEENGEVAASSAEMQALHGELGSSGRVRGWALTRQQLRALFTKRFLHARRSRRGLFAQIVLPAFFVGLALFFSLIVPPFGHYPPLELQPDMYGSQVSFFSEDDPGNLRYAQLLNALLSEPTVHGSCVKNSSGLGQDCAQPADHSFSVPPVSEAVARVFAMGNWTPQFPSPACQCSSPGARRMLPDCPEAAGGLPPPQMRIGLGDVMQNLTGRNISDYLVKTYPRIISRGLRTKKFVNEIRYGGFSLGGSPSLGQGSGPEILSTIQEFQSLFYGSQNTVVHHLLQNLSAWAEGLDTQNNVKVWFNNKGWHAMVAFINVLNNGVLRAYLPPGADPQAYRITTLNHPLSLTKEQLSEAALMASSVDVLVSICVLFAMSFVPASFVLFLIEDRVSRAKHLQLLGGLPPTLYWLGNFAWDMCNYLVPAGLVVLIFLGFQQQAYVAPPNLPALLLLLLLYGWSITPLMYPASFLFSVPSTAYVVLTCLNLFIGINGSVATFVLELFSNQKLKDVSWILKRVFLIFPHFCLGRGLIDMVRNQAMADAFLRLGDEQFQSPLSWELVGKNLFAMALQGPVFLLLTLLLQHRAQLLPRWSLGPQLLLREENQEEDEDVRLERERVQQGATQGDVLVLKDLTKIYPGQKKPAVDHLCVGIPPGECFGLLGVNGAGKTSTFRMVTGDTPMSGGEAILMGYSILSDLQAAQSHMGYCPQFDAITELLTGREHLEFFSRLRGVPEGEVAQVAQWGLTKLGLLQYADQPSGGYSGGNKRKLSTAIALVGGPPVIFLDEPTTGMDPRARRFLWNSVLGVIKEGRSVVLTSHSMEECEALCTRLAIMVNGRFQCLGSAQHLKNRFGEGYTVSLRVPTLHPGPAQDFMEASFPGALLKEHHGCLLRYQLPAGHCPLARLFSELAMHSPHLGIEDFSVTQTTLDQVFVYFAKDQGEEDSLGKPASPCTRPSARVPHRVSCFLEDTSVAESLV